VLEFLLGNTRHPISTGGEHKNLKFQIEGVAGTICVHLHAICLICICHLIISFEIQFCTEKQIFDKYNHFIKKRVCAIYFLEHLDNILLLFFLIMVLLVIALDTGKTCRTLNGINL